VDRIRGGNAGRSDRFLKQPQYLTATAHGRGFGATCFTTLAPTCHAHTRASTRTHARTHAAGAWGEGRGRCGESAGARLRSTGRPCTMPVDTPPISEHQLCSTPSLCSTLARTHAPPLPPPAHPLPRDHSEIRRSSATQPGEPPAFPPTARDQSSASGPPSPPPPSGPHRVLPKSARSLLSPSPEEGAAFARRSRVANFISPL